MWPIKTFESWWSVVKRGDSSGNTRLRRQNFGYLSLLSEQDDFLDELPADSLLQNQVNTSSWTRSAASHQLVSELIGFSPFSRQLPGCWLAAVLGIGRLPPAVRTTTDVQWRRFYFHLMFLGSEWCRRVRPVRFLLGRESFPSFDLRWVLPATTQQQLLTNHAELALNLQPRHEK